MNKQQTNHFVSMSLIKPRTFFEAVIEYRWFSILSLCCLIGFIALGSWQMERLEWKEGLLSSIKKAQESEPLRGVELIHMTKNDPQNLYFRKVTLSGYFLHDHEMHFAGKYHNNTLGYHVITPFVIIDPTPRGPVSRSDDQHSIERNIIFVNRGWVPEKQKLPESRPGSNGDNGGMKFISGFVSAPPKQPGWFVPDNSPKDNVWLYYEPDLMISHFAENKGDNYRNALPFIVRSDKGASNIVNGKILPVPLKHNKKLNIPNDHLQYAITWYALAIVMLIMYPLYLIHKIREKKK